MKRLLSILAAAAAIFSCSENLPENVAAFKAPKGGKVYISMVFHGSIAISYKDFQIQVDPVGNSYGTQIDYSSFPKADLILISHEHGDHLDPALVEQLSKETTKVFCNASSAPKLPGAEIMANGDVNTVGNVTVTACPAYNVSEGHLQFHPTGNGNGYLLNVGGLNIYVAGDTELIPELADLKDIDVCFLPANQPFTMTVEDCIEAAKIISPKVLVPYHLGQTDMQAIKDGLEGSGIEVQLYESLR